MPLLLLPLLLFYVLGCAPSLAATNDASAPAAAIVSPPSLLRPSAPSHDPPAAAPSAAGRTVPQPAPPAPAPSAANDIALTPVAAPAPPAAVVAASSTAAEQAAALLALRAEWHDPIGFLADWTASNAPDACSWLGVTCDTDSFITVLFLAGLSLSGVLSPAIANLSSLSILDLSRNRFNGRIPVQLGSLRSLTTLHLANNRFNDSIPSAVVESSSLQFLLLHRNYLYGEVPATISKARNLRYISLHYNNLDGPFLSSLTNLTKLAALYVSFNKFHGIIPPEIGNLSRLVYLDLSGNSFSGIIPSSIGSLSLLRRLVLNDNQLVGPLPAELGNLHKAIFMNLSHNVLSGIIPREIGSMASLRTLDLGYNNFEGSIPESLGNLTMLKMLNLSYNRLSGTVPHNGVLVKFNYLSYMGNGLLCGEPLTDSECNAEQSQTGFRNRWMPHNRERTGLGKSGKVTIIVVAASFGAVVVFVILVFCSCRTSQPEAVDRPFERPRNSSGMDMTDTVRKAKLEVYMEGFSHSYEEIVSHAGYFDTAHVVGKGRFATVYRSDLPGGRHLAVKVFNNSMNQFSFESEVARLHESVSHVSTLLPIRGYYSSTIEKAIFYDFMPKGTLYDVLHKSPTLLNWPKRVSIALGVAQAIHYLHRRTSPSILHKDLKSSNVFLDDDLSPHIADYGLMSMVSKIVVETPGYTPPEFTTLSYSVRRYTEKTDVYSFGVLLLELLTGKSPVASREEKRPSFKKTPSSSQVNAPRVIDDDENNYASFQDEGVETKGHLVTWVLGLHQDGQGLQAFDPFVVQSCPSLDHQIQAYNLAILCIDDEPPKRPHMLEIISILEILSSNATRIEVKKYQS